MNSRPPLRSKFLVVKFLAVVMVILFSSDNFHAIAQSNLGDHERAVRDRQGELELAETVARQRQAAFDRESRLARQATALVKSLQNGKPSPGHERAYLNRKQVAQTNETKATQALNTAGRELTAANAKLANAELRLNAAKKALNTAQGQNPPAAGLKRCRTCGTDKNVRPSQTFGDVTLYSCLKCEPRTDKQGERGATAAGVGEKVVPMKSR